MLIQDSPSHGLAKDPETIVGSEKRGLGWIVGYMEVILQPLDQVFTFLLQRRAGDRWCHTGQRVTDHARFVGEESALTCGANTLRNRRGDERVPDRSAADEWLR
jgi:hypothetical protein